METSGITAITATQATSQSQSLWQARREQQQQTLQALGTALQSGNLSDAQAAFRSLTQNSSTPSSAASATGTPQTAVAKDLTALGTALKSGSLTDAQEAYKTLMQDIQSMQQTQGTHKHHHHHHHQTQPVDASSSGTATATTPGTTGSAVNTINTTA